MINNHFFIPNMNIESLLNDELLAQHFPEITTRQKELNTYKEIARHYADMENAIAV